MKKTIRLTESDLNKLIKKIIREQVETSADDVISSSSTNKPQSQPANLNKPNTDRTAGFNALKEPVYIKALSPSGLLIDLTHQKGSAWGCRFLGNIRGQNSKLEFLYSCDNKKLSVQNSQSLRGRDDLFGSVEISEKAKVKLSAACACGDYVKTDTSPSNQYV